MRPEVHSFPVSDGAFRAVVQAALNAVFVDSNERSGELSSVLERVKRRYPNARLVPRDEMGGYESQPIWYAFRDGRVRTRNDERERLYQSLSRARETLDRSDDALKHAAAVAHRAGYEKR